MTKLDHIDENSFAHLSGAVISTCRYSYRTPHLQLVGLSKFTPFGSRRCVWTIDYYECGLRALYTYL